MNDDSIYEINKKGASELNDNSSSVNSRLAIVTNGNYFQQSHDLYKDSEENSEEERDEIRTLTNFQFDLVISKSFFFWNIIDQLRLFKCTPEQAAEKIKSIAFSVPCFTRVIV